jgi:hypothetical protein
MKNTISMRNTYKNILQTTNPQNLKLKILFDLKEKTKNII